MSAGLLVQALVTGLAAGAAYALLGIGFALLYRLTGILQLALGDMAGAAAFVALALVAGTSPTARGGATGGFALAAGGAVAWAGGGWCARSPGLLRLLCLHDSPACLVGRSRCVPGGAASPPHGDHWPGPRTEGTGRRPGRRAGLAGADSRRCPGHWRHRSLHHHPANRPRAPVARRRPARPGPRLRGR